MSFVRLPEDAFDVYTVIARPERSFSSSSFGVTGSLKVFTRSSPILRSRDISTGSYIESTSNVSTALADLQNSSLLSSNYYGSAQLYLESLDALQESPLYQKSVSVYRFSPVDEFDFDFDPDLTAATSSIISSDYLKKSLLRNSVIPYNRSKYQSLNWGYTNYLSLHFADGVGPSSASMVYPASGNAYIPEDEFTIEFFVNPKYTVNSGSEYQAGTIFHASSSFAISIVSGSRVDAYGRPDSFRVLLQLSQSADQSPDLVDLTVTNNTRAFPGDLAFVSDDLMINQNQWHHVAVRWSPSVNFGTGSFLIDNVVAGVFQIPSSSVTRPPEDAEAVFVGARYEGPRTSINRPGGFFNSNAVSNEGVYDDFSGSFSQPTTFSIQNQFKGELHELRIWNSYRGSDLIFSGSKMGVEISEDLLFYVPPFMYPSSSDRQFIDDSAFKLGVKNGVIGIGSSTPFNEKLAFDIGGQEINLENHTLELVRKVQPRLLFLTASVSQIYAAASVSTVRDADSILGYDGQTVRRNLSILPCDDGDFYPNFDLLPEDDIFQNDDGAKSGQYVNLKFKSLEELYDTSGGTTERIILDETGDPSSNLVTLFDISNIFYGSRIHPKSLEITDTSFTGSNGTLSIRLKDNGRGLLYRADASGSHATWSSVGAAFYEDGIAAITAPYLGKLFGKTDFSLSLRGESPIHVQETQVIAPSWTFNSSSNPQYLSLTSSDYANDQSNFVYITTLNLHDENLNVVGRASFSQPIVKRDSDRIMFRLKKDF